MIIRIITYECNDSITMSAILEQSFLVLGGRPICVNVASFIGLRTGIFAGRSFENAQQPTQHYLHTGSGLRSGRAHG